MLFRHYDAISWEYALPFIPHLIFSFVVLPFIRTTRPRFGTSLVRMAHTYSYGHSVVTNVLAKPLNWHPTNAKNAGVSAAYANLVGFGAAYVLLYVAFVAYAIATDRFPAADLNYYPVLFWIWYFLATNLLFLAHGFRTMDRMRREAQPKGHAAWRVRTAGFFVTALFAVAGAGLLAGSDRGIGAVIAAPAPIEAPAAPAEETVEPVVSALPSSYAEIAAAGDSVTVLYRRIVSRRCDDTSASLNGPARTFIETVLAQRDGRASIDVGAVAIADAATLDELFLAGQTLGESAAANWATYADLVTFDESCAN